MSWLAAPLEYGFFVRALLAAAVVGGLCGAVGTFVVLRRMSYIGHGLSHSVLGGVAVALALGQHRSWGAIGATLGSALLIDRIARRRGLYVDAAIGIVTTALFAFGLAVLSLADGLVVNLEALLFGNVLGVGRADIVLVLVAAAAAAFAVFALYKPLLFTTFDPEVAAVQGVRAGAVELVLNLLVAAVVVVGVQVLGVTLIAAAVVVPAATARLLTGSFGRLLVGATALGALTGVTGLYASYHADVPSGAAIVLLGAAVFVVVALATALRARPWTRDSRA